MPPKKAPAGGRGKKGATNVKSKEAKKARAEARAKKQLKKLKKFSNVLYEDEFIWTKSRGELEVIAWTLQRQVEADRSERIAMRYERDWFFEMTQIYLQKIRKLRRKMDVHFHEARDRELDLEEARLFTRLARKNAMYTTLMKTSALELKFRKRYKRLKKIINILIRYFIADDKSLNEQIEALPAARKERLAWEAEDLKPKLKQRLNEIYDEQDVYIGILQKFVDAQLKHNKVTIRSEILLDLDAWSHAGDLEMRRHEHEYAIAIDLYVAQVHNCLSLIMLVLNLWDDIDADNSWRDANKKIYYIAADYFGQNFNGILYNFLHEKSMAIQSARLIQRLDTSYKSLRLTESDLKEQIMKLRAARINYDHAIELKYVLNIMYFANLYGL